MSTHATIALRPYRDSDAPVLAREIGNFNVSRQTGSIPYPYTVEVAEGWICLNDWAWRRRLRFNMAIVDETGTLMGGIGLFPSRFSRTSPPRWEIGYWLGEAHWGRGYATRAVELALDFLRTEIGDRVCDAAYNLHNEASGRVLEKCGFFPTGEIVSSYSLAAHARSDVRVMAWTDDPAPSIPGEPLKAAT